MRETIIKLFKLLLWIFLFFTFFTWFSINSYAASSSSSSSSSSGSSRSSLSSSSSSSSSGSSRGSSSNSSSSSSSSGSSLSGSSSSSSGQPLDTYIITEGPFIGIQLYATQGLPAVSSPFNPTTKASGTIFDAEIETKQMGCSKTHFHGILFNKKEPFPYKCGWGKVIKFSEASLNLQNISTAINSEITTFKDIQINKRDVSDFAGAQVAIGSAINVLNNLNTGASVSNFSNKNKHSLNRNISCALKKDNKAKGIIDDLKKGMGHLNDERLVRGILKGALRCKRSIIEMLIKFESKNN